MKQKLMFCLLLAGSFYFTTNAQIKKGKWIGGLMLNGSKKTAEGYIQNAFNASSSISTFNSQVTVSKMITKHWFIGMGLVYGNVVDKNVQPYLTQPLNNKTINENIGILIQTGYYKELSKNLYLSTFFNIGYGDFTSNFKQNYGSINERKIKEKGYIITTNLAPIQFSYLYKNKLLISLNIFNINYNFRRLNSSSSSMDYSNSSELTYSLNPFQNGITFSYILN